MRRASFFSPPAENAQASFQRNATLSNAQYTKFWHHFWLICDRKFLESPCDADFAAELFSHYPDLSYGEFADRLFGDEEAEPSDDFILAFARAAVDAGGNRKAQINGLGPTSWTPLILPLRNVANASSTSAPKRSGAWTPWSTALRGRPS
jgi:hypothetical protein